MLPTVTGIYDLTLSHTTNSDLLILIFDLFNENKYFVLDD